MGLILLAEQQEKAKVGGCTEQDRTIRLRVVQGRAGGSSPPSLSRGCVCFCNGALQMTQGKDAPGQSRSQAPGWGAYSYQGSVMGQQARLK